MTIPFPSALARRTRRPLAAALGVSLLLGAHGAAAQFDADRVYRETDAVAAHYPDPAIEIASPAFTTPAPHLTTQEEMTAFIATLATQNPALRVVELGKSQEGRSIPLLVFARGPLSHPVEIAKNGKPTVLVIGQQHGNEPAGGEAALAFAAELSRDAATQALLDKINVLIVPRANPDGAFHFIRGLVDGDDVNRDHLLLASPEGRALGTVFAQYQPEVVLDCHEFSVAGRWIRKFGVLQDYDALVQYATVSNLPPLQMETSETMFRQPLLRAFAKQGLRHSWYFTTSRADEGKLVSMGGVVPDTGRNIAGLRNAISFLLETRGVEIGTAHFKRRVFTHLVAIRSIAGSAAANAPQLLRIGRELRASVAAQAGRGTVDIGGRATVEKRELTFRDPNDGATRKIDVDWASALKITPQLTRPRPVGYLLRASEAPAATRLMQLGVTVERVTQAASVPGQAYQVTGFATSQREDVTGSAGSAKAAVKRVTTRLEDGPVEVAEGDFYIPLDQPLANLVVAALEPESQSSFVANGVLAPALDKGSVDARLPLSRIGAQFRVPATALPPLEAGAVR